MIGWRHARSGLFMGLFATVAINAPAAAQEPNYSAGPDDPILRVVEGFKAINAWNTDDARHIATGLLAEYPDDPAVTALVGTVKMHLGDYEGAVTDLRRAYKADIPANLVAEAPAAEAARVATQGYAETVSDNFILRYRVGKDEILVPYALDTLDKSLDRISKLLGWRPEGRILVEFYPAASTLARVSSLTDEDIENSGTIALCRWSRLMVTTPRGVMFGYGWRDTLAHELTHLLIGGASKNTVPIWLHEGIAKYVETAWRTEPGRGLPEKHQLRLRAAAKKNRLITFEQMHPSMAKLPTQEQTSLAFAEVFTMVEYLVEKKGWSGIRQVLAAMREGASDKEAIAQVYGSSMKRIEKRWMKSLKTRAIRRGDGVAIDESRLIIKDSGDVPDDQLHGVSKEGRRYARAADLLYTRGRLTAAQKELQKAYDATKSPMISAKLALLALSNNDLAAAKKAALNAIGQSANLAGPNVTLAQVLQRTGQGDQAWKPLERAIDINPFDPRIHALTIELLGKEDDSPQKRHAVRALQLLNGDGRPSPLRLGKGGLVQIQGPPFRRVFLRPEGSEGDAIPTALVTPTPPFAVKPGRYTLELVPPAGPAKTQSIQIQPVGDDGAPQRVTPPAEGS